MQKLQSNLNYIIHSYIHNDNFKCSIKVSLNIECEDFDMQPYRHIGIKYLYTI